MSKVQSFKAKIRSKFLPAETKERLARASSTAIDGLQLILGLFKAPADVVGVPGLKAGVEGLLIVIDVIKVQISIALLFRALMNKIQIENISKCGRSRATGGSDQ
jgi:hypothetical protein